MQLQGTGLSDKNVRLRFFALVFIGIIAFGAVLYWRDITLTSAEYVEPALRMNKNARPDTLRSINYQLEVFETSPSVK